MRCYIMIKKILQRKNYFIEIIFDIIIFGFSYIMAFYLRLDGNIPPEVESIIFKTLPEAADTDFS